MSKRKFGVELEYLIGHHKLLKVAEAISRETGYKAASSQGTSYWSVVSEYEGNELTTPILSDIRVMNRAMKILKKEITKSCGCTNPEQAQRGLCGPGFGFHVHIDVRDLKDSDGLVFLDIYHVLSNIERYLFKMHPVFRRREIWTKPLKKHNRQIMEDLEGLIAGLEYPDTSRLGWWHKVKDQYVLEYLNEDSLEILSSYLDKESCMSFSTIPEHGSLEFRFGTSTINPSYVSNWVKICRLVVDRIVSDVKRGEIKKIPSFNRFLDWLKPDKSLRSWMIKQAKDMEKIRSPRSLPV